MLKRTFDITFSLIALVLLSWFLFLVYLFLTLKFGGKGLFLQKRVGRFGNLFTIYKFRTMNPQTHAIDGVSKFLRDSKIDELPQLYNVLIGDMSFVGPRPDIPGYYDQLAGDDRKILELRPGITSVASIKYKNEESILAQQQNPLQYNDQVLFPDKVRLNREYYDKQGFWYDIKILIRTLTNG